MKKIWLLVFSGMFLIPEILWSPVINFYYELFISGRSGGTVPIRNSFFQHTDNILYLKLLLIFQLIGLFILLVKVFKLSSEEINQLLKVFLSFVIAILLLATCFVLYFIQYFTIDTM